MKKTTVLCLMGPTASGKTDIAVQLAQAYPIKLISVDSALIYKGLDIGSGKPEYPHALMDICDPGEPYSVARFCKDARAAIEQAFSEDKIPCLVGGTMMYFKALLDGLSDMPSTDPLIREKLNRALEAHGSQILWEKLRSVDPISAQKIHPKDPQRITRALEVYEISGKPLSDYHAKSTPLEYPTLQYALFPQDRPKLHLRIAQRFEQMMTAGLLEEVRALHNRGDLHINLPSIRCVGYRQCWEHLEGQLTLEEASERAIIATRQLAKRQLTWLKSWENLHCFDPFEHVDPAQYFVQELKNKGLL